MPASRIFRSLRLLLITAVLAACTSGPKIRSDADPSAQLADYKTFGFFERVATDKSNYSTVLTTRLKDATRRELRNRGYQETATNPQLLVNFNTNVENRTDVHSSSSASFYGYRAGMYGAWSSYPYDVYTTHYQEGTLAIDLVDAARQQLVWQGIAQARLTKSMIENPGATIDSVVTDIFAQYPVPARAPASAQ